MNTLKDVIDDFVLEKDDNNSLFKHSRRTHIKSLALRGLKKMNYKIKGNVRAFSFHVPVSLKVELPSDFEDYVRISVKEGCDLTPFGYKDALPYYVESYLQDCNNEFIYDCCNEIMSIATTTSCRHKDCVQDCEECERLQVCEEELDYWFNIEEDNLILSPDLEDKEVFVEYMSSGWHDGMDECEIKVNTKYHEVLLSWIKWQYLRSINEHMGRIEEYRIYYNQLNKELKNLKVKVDNNKIIKILDSRFTR